MIIPEKELKIRLDKLKTDFEYLLKVNRAPHVEKKILENINLIRNIQNAENELHTLQQNYKNCVNELNKYEFSSMLETPRRGEIWIHHKTKNFYKILYLGKMEASGEEVVMYQRTDKKDHPDVWVRPLCEFIEEIDGVQRFYKPKYGW